MMEGKTTGHRVRWVTRGQKENVTCHILHHKPTIVLKQMQFIMWHSRKTESMNMALSGSPIPIPAAAHRRVYTC